MKKFFAVLGVLVFIVVVFVVLFLFSVSRLDELALNQTETIVKEIESYYKEHGRYPRDIEAYLNGLGIAGKVDYLFFQTSIELHEDKGELSVMYHRYPFGPFYGYTFKTKEWFYSE